MLDYFPLLPGDDGSCSPSCPPASKSRVVEGCGLIQSQVLPGKNAFNFNCLSEDMEGEFL